MVTDIVPVIMCGGSGTRLWPLSTPDKPKPFHRLAGDGTLFQQALRRAVAKPFTRRPIVVALARNAALVRAQAEALAIAVDLVLEREGRDTCVAALSAALAAHHLHGPCLLGILAADHYIPDGAAFSAMLQQALPAGRSGALVVFGVVPRAPSQAFGYIVPGEGRDPAVPVRHFVEKPAEPAAAALIAGGARWNSGNFLMGSAQLLAAARLHCPGIHDAVTNAFSRRVAAGGAMEIAVDVECAAALPLDRAIVERFADVRMVPANFDWSDVGTWDEVRALSGRHGPFTFGNGQTVHVVGLDDVIVVATADGLLVTRPGQANQLKKVLDSARNNEG